mmetsp:Transcript_16329/g.48631  ORF Transcript_16329/g.48631 Transcript_16329/m.48631 type:complete len:212 (+) Transcript_16329:123-758(+)
MRPRRATPAHGWVSRSASSCSSSASSESICERDECMAPSICARPFWASAKRASMSSTPSISLAPPGTWGSNISVLELNRLPSPSTRSASRHSAESSDGPDADGSMFSQSSHCCMISCCISTSLHRKLSTSARSRAMRSSSACRSRSSRRSSTPSAACKGVKRGGELELERTIDGDSAWQYTSPASASCWRSSGSSMSFNSQSCKPTAPLSS